MVTLTTLKEKFEFTGYDVEELINQVYDTFIFCRQKASKYGVMCMLDKYIDANADNIKLMMKHPKYNGRFQIVIDDVIFNRDIDTREIAYWFDNIINTHNTKITNAIRKKTNNEGKTLTDVIKEKTACLPTKINIKDITNFKKTEFVDTSEFDSYGYTVESNEKYDNFMRLWRIFRSYTSKNLDNYTASVCNDIDEKLRFSDGMKTSRALNKILIKYGIDKVIENYNSEYAKYSDMINPMERKLPYIISLHPVDFLKMSVGTTWSSCHTIDPYNNFKINLTSRGTGTFSGQCRGGVLSYMLDSVSFVTYVLANFDKIDEPEKDFKLYRNMAHFNVDSGILIQGRVYPQSNDGTTDLYKKLRLIMQKEFATLSGQEYVEYGDNSTWILKGNSANNTCYISSVGRHYQDYTCSSFGCTMSYLRNMRDNIDNGITIGCDGVDIYNGEVFSSSGSLSSGYSCLPSEIESETFIPQ